MTLNQFHKQSADEDAARAGFERARRPDGPVCPRLRPCRSCVLSFDTPGLVLARLACMVLNGDGRVLRYGFLTAGAA